MSHTELPALRGADGVQQHVGRVCPCGLRSGHSSQGPDLPGHEREALFYKLGAAVPGRDVLLCMTRVCSSGHRGHPRVNRNLWCGKLRPGGLREAEGFDRCVFGCCGALDGWLCWARARAEEARGGDYIITAGDPEIYCVLACSARRAHACGCNVWGS